MKKETKKIYWDRYWTKGNLNYNEKIIQIIKKKFPIKGLKVLEVGAGSGATSLFLADNGAEVTALDYSEESINLMKKNNINKSKIKLVHGDAFQMPFDNDQFDLVFSQGLIEHYRDPERIIKEKKRVTRKGGYILIDVPQVYNFYTVKKNILMLFNKWFPGWETSFSRKRLENLVRSCGLSVERCYAYGHFHNFFRIQEKLFHRKIVPDFMARFYNCLWQAYEKTPLSLYTLFCIIVLARKDM
ncbi:MAG: class I SAM-dependent methyltransferase [bacterium]|nr:class I SAM-dependent methyltransferase [bacterium]